MEDKHLAFFHFRPHVSSGAHTDNSITFILFICFDMTESNSNRPQGAEGKDLAAFGDAGDWSDPLTMQSASSGLSAGSIKIPPQSRSGTRNQGVGYKQDATSATIGGPATSATEPSASSSKEKKGKAVARDAGAYRDPTVEDGARDAPEEEIEKARVEIDGLLELMGISKEEFLTFRSELNRRRAAMGERPGPALSKDLRRALGVEGDEDDQNPGLDPGEIAIGIAKPSDADQDHARGRGGGSRFSSPIVLGDDEDNYMDAYNAAFPDQQVVRVGAGYAPKSLAPLVPISAEREKEKASGVVSAPVKDAADSVDMYGPAAHLLNVDNRLIVMGRNGWHIPLTACTTPILNGINDGSRAKGVKQGSRSGVSLHVLDLTIYGDERSMNLEDWREAWQNFLAFLPGICEAFETSRFRQHYEFLCRLDWLREEFAAALEFDITTRRRWFLAPADKKPFFSVGSATYITALNEIRLRCISARLSAKSQAPAQRYHPYATAHQQPFQGGAGGPAGGPHGHGGGGRGRRGYDGRQPFPEGRAAESAGGLCLICAESGHRARDCGRSTVRGGRPAFATFANSRLVTAKGRRPICAAWNVGGSIPCKSSRCPDTLGCHVCSYCGATGHTAANNRCL